MNMIGRLWIPSFALVFLFFGPPAVWAASITWTNSSGGNWNVADNWSPNQVPGAADTALINTPGTYVVNVNASADVASLTVGGAAGAQTLQVNNTSLTATKAAINGTLTVTNSVLYGAITVNSGAVLDVFNGTLEPTNSLTVAGGGVLNVAASDFYLEGPLTNAGTINLTNATLYIYNNNGVNWDGGIDNPGVINFYGASGDSITSYGGGYEYLINGGMVNEQTGTGTSLIDVYIGGLAGTYNAALGTTVEFRGGGAGNPLTVGTPPVLNGPGEYEFTSGYLLLSGEMITNLLLTGGTLELGPGFEQSGAITNLTLDGITLGPGTYQVNGALTVTNSTLYGAITVNSGGVLDVFGATLEPTNSLTVAGGGVLNVAAPTFYLEGPLTNAGTINLTNATFYIYNNNGVNWDGGIDNPGVINFYGASGDSIASYGGGYEYVINGGTVNEQTGTGTSTIQPSFTNNGTVNAPSGILNFNGSFTTVGGTLSFGVSNLTSFGQIKILGTVALNGTASVTWLGGFTPAIGNSFALLTYGSYSGSFANITLPAGSLGEGIYGATVFSLMITNATTQTNLPVFLSIKLVNTNFAVISWPSSATNYSLQTITNLSSGSWSNVISGITIVGSNDVLTNNVNGKASFFRLKSQ
jgi:hypothetical protein